ncbi:AraC family transcriptional regulator [Vibrio tubiashii]|uniref:AraC family transcriptional regulator n=2 Tax=Vibrio tubiashii TaxID=29498 RepID=F9T1A7_9VIBR|nr:AraC family transcriptional regulator [Vibrio tubiashii]AIW16244.1 XRE family transcriptional regulator [Vibrio tubiashii ATCC 19109]EGU58331.1 AraC family transcriptional regulator [Vibrio tubiashii ATCC 19109]EIF04789.1 AraC family transcriptional regulator [Vibrio tubiashii NCIMB 1337 = ATCC 19106]MCG9580693.1 AraC family transcriptional regulator [Vibrio tubiashii]MCG9614284.1 AraC family transcriptional regulator [Vibrio tubiashii]
MSLAELMQQYVDMKGFDQLEGIAKTEIEGLYFYRSSQGNTRRPFVYQSGVIVLGQGKKNIYLGNQPVQYGPDDYLVVGVPMPLECEAIAVDGEPLLGLSIDIDPQVLHRLVNKLETMNCYKPCADGSVRSGLKSVAMDDDMLGVCKRLMKALCNPIELAVLGDSLMEELAFRALMSKEGHVLFDLARHEGHYARVAKALDYLHQNYTASVTVQDLAEQANMSVSAFHQAFRSVTLASPIQYIKKVRLDKARELIQLEGVKVGEAARLVGYNSTSQFSREFKRHFNETPKAKLVS